MTPAPASQRKFQAEGNTDREEPEPVCPFQTGGPARGEAGPPDASVKPCIRFSLKQRQRLWALLTLVELFQYLHEGMGFPADPIKQRRA